MKVINLKDYEEIVKAGNLYLEGCRKGDSSIMKPAFHENATINGDPIQTLLMVLMMQDQLTLLVE